MSEHSDRFREKREAEDKALASKLWTDGRVVGSDDGDIVLFHGEGPISELQMAAAAYAELGDPEKIKVQVTHISGGR